MAGNIVREVDDWIRPRHVLVSVFDKRDLQVLVNGLVSINDSLRIFSTGGTYKRIAEILGPEQTEKHLIRVSDYTGQPETQGGLVKTLDFKIYLGLLTETYNTAHQQDLLRTKSVAIDMVVGNLYPFRETIAKKDVTLEQARGNIDIGGPCMIRASAKNFIRVASVVDPGDYDSILSDMTANKGALSLGLRFRLAQKAFQHTAAYDRTIADYLGLLSFDDMAACYQ